MIDKFQEILNELELFKQKDYSFTSGRILGSMCSHPHPIAKEAYIKFLETNLGDPKLFPGLKEIESICIKKIGDLLHAPESATGLVVSGGTEGNITSIWLAKELTGGKDIIIPESAHFSFQKIESIMDMKLRKIPLNKEYCLDLSKIKKHITQDTAAVLCIAGSTELGTIDAVPEISDLCIDEHLFLHVDAAFGGFVIPFLRELHYDVPDFDFFLKGVSTISIDFHKMGYSAIPLGILFMKNKDWLEEISVPSLCINSDRQSGLLGTRSGGPVAAAYAVWRYLGKEGYKKIVENCMILTKYIEEKILEIGLKLIRKPVMNVLAIRLKNPTEVTHRLAQHGWIVNRITRLSAIRLVIMPQIKREHIDEFIPLLKQICKEVGEL